MAQYKVPQDVEADDKLLGPFSFRQFVYLMVASGLIATAVGLFQLFPALAIIPVPFAFFFLALALPLKKDQPMETYLAAIVAYHLKPKARIWMTGQQDNPIYITAPKNTDDFLARDITSEEATHRLSFLADIVDTGGYAIKGAGANPMREDLMAEANATPDMFETYQSQVINRVIDQDKMSRHQTAVKEMREAIERNNNVAEPIERSSAVAGQKVIARGGEAETAKILLDDEPVLTPAPELVKEKIESSSELGESAEAEPEKQAEARTGGLRDYAVLKPDIDIDSSNVVIRPQKELNKREQKVTVPGMDYLLGREEMVKEATKKEANTEKSSQKPVNNSIMELANNPDFTVATIAKEANRINRKEKGDEVFISLH